MSRFWKRINRILALILAGVIAFSNDNVLTVFATSTQTVSDNNILQGMETGADNQTQSGTVTDGNDQTQSGTTSGGGDQTQSGTALGEGDQTQSGTVTGEGDQTQSGTAPGEGDQTQSGTTSGEGDQTQSGTVTGGGDQTQDDAETGDGSQTQSMGNDVSGNSIDKNVLQSPRPGSVSANEPSQTVISECEDGKTHEYEEIIVQDGTVEGYRCVFCQREIDEETYVKELGILHDHVWTRPEGMLIPTCDTCSRERKDCEAEDGYEVHIYELVLEEGQPDKYRCLVCGYEKDSLDEWDVTQEMFMQIMGIASMAYTLNGETSSLPTTIEELNEAEASGYYANKTFNVENFADLAALQSLSNDGFEFEGYTVNFVGRKYATGISGDNTNWDLTGLSKTVFSGLGTEEHPFKGTLTSFYTGGSLRFTIATPLLNYVATGATVSELQINSVITGNGSSPVGIIAAHLVAGAADDKVNLSNLSLSGTVKNNGGAAGILFGEVVNTEDTPIKLCYEQSDIALKASVTADHAGGLTGQTYGKVQLHQGTVFTSGSIYGNLSAGMLAGTMGQEGTLSIGTETDTTVTSNVSGSGASGGLVGIMNQGEIVRADGKTAVVTIGGKVSGSVVGGLVGQLDRTSFEIDHITINARISSNAVSQIAAGGVFGIYAGEMQGTVDSTQWRQLKAVTINESVSGGNAAGGVIGVLTSSNIRIGDEDTAESILIKGPIYATGAAGGVIGSAQGQYIEVYNATVNNSISTASSIGGVIGVVGNGAERSVILVKDATVSAKWVPGAANKIQGGIFGEVCSNSMAALDGTIDVAGMTIGNTHATMTWGHIAGKQSEALVYFEETCDYTRPTGKNWVDDIGNYGGVYRNGSWGEADAIISYAGKDVTGTVTNSGSQWLLDTEADMIRLAIMLNTQGNFATGSFAGTDKATLLTAEYSLCPADDHFDLEQSGIMALNRNDGVGKNECFTGKLIGTNGKRIGLKLEGTEERLTRQEHVSLFPYAGSGAVFENLFVVRNLTGVTTAAAGLAAYGVNDTTIRNVDVEMTMTGSGYTTRYYYGGFFAVYTAAAGTKLQVEDCQIGGKITIYQNTANEGVKQFYGGMIALYRSQTAGSNLPIIKIDGLELTGEITSDSRFTSGFITHINDSNTNQDKVVLAMNGIHIRDSARLVITDIMYTGGFLGRWWFDVVPYKENGESYSLKNLTVGDDTNAASGPYFASHGFFGCMVHTVTGRIQLKDTKIQNGTFYGSNGATARNGLLFWQGHDALIELEGYEIAGLDVGVKDIDYEAVKSKVAITGTYPYFSDVVGNNISPYTSGGIVNIISEKFDTNMTAYSNHCISASNGTTQARYYYNLFGTSLAGEDGFLEGRKLDSSNLIITDADQMMIWHLNQYVNSSIRRFVAPYFTAGTLAAASSAVNKPISIKGRIDLENKSYYPTPVAGNFSISGLENAEIIFYGEKVTNATTKTPKLDKENHMMHAGLLLSTSGNITVNGGENYLTLSGSVSNIGENSGALFVRTINGAKNIYKIRLKDLFITGYNGEHGYGLLVGNIWDNSDMNISWIETEYSTTSKKAASSLIGQVGEDPVNGINNTTDLRLDFTNIKVDDKVSGIFKWSSLIDQHFYTDSTEENTGRVRYLFTQEAYLGTNGTTNQKDPFAGTGFQGNNDYSAVGPYVTVGAELKDGVEYWNVDGSADLGITNWENYLPYVCTSHATGKEIEVNPKNASITEGCGTYEDPYQISSAKQFLALSRYLINKDDAKYLEGWQIRRTGVIVDGNSDEICDKSHPALDLRTYGVDDDFPSQDELRRAYYIITVDIDFTALISATDRNIAQEFVGLGTENMPFAGVIVGKKDGVTGNYPTITLPYKKAGNTCTNFGFIQYAKGVVVKDLIITSKETAETTLTDVVRVSANAGTVMACILGGDNIIDNVTVSNKIAVQTTTSSGGYVGVLRQGALILRNMGEDKLSTYKCGTLNTDNRTLLAFTTEQMKDDPSDRVADYPYVSGVIGRVENGFVIYEDSTPAGNVILEHEATSIAGVYSHSVLPISKTYDIITKSGMNVARIPISSDGINFNAVISNAAQLQLVSMAINSEAFSVYYNQGGYDKQAVCRKADYDEVGNVTTATDEYNLATKKDDGVYWFPYIYQYFTFDGIEAAESDKTTGNGFYATLESYTSSDGISGYRSKLNAVTPDIASAMTYKLKHSDPSLDISVVDYDLSVYRRGFRGFGATYRIFTSDTETVVLDVREDLVNNATNQVALKNRALADFRANFNGNGATVKAEMINDYDKNIHTIALFNDLMNINAKNDYSIQNLVVTGTYSNYDQRVTTTNNSHYSADRAGAVVGIMRKPWEIINVTVLDTMVESRGYAAGIVAWVSPAEIAGKKNYTFEDCKVLSVKDEDGDGKATHIRTIGGSSGGIIGVMSPRTTGTLRDYALTVLNCQVSGTKTPSGDVLYVDIINDGNRSGLVSNNSDEDYARGRCGGFIGLVGKRQSTQAEVSIALTITDTNSYEKDIQYVAINGGDSTGGVLGEHYSWRQTENSVNLIINNITVADSKVESKNQLCDGSDKFCGVAGIVGKIQKKVTCQISNCKVQDTDIRSTRANVVNNVRDLYAGGVIGFCYAYSKVYLEDIQVTGTLDTNNNPQYEISTKLANVGGLLGSFSYNNNDATKSYVEVRNCQVLGMKVTSDNRTEEHIEKDVSSGKSTDVVGGLIGWATTMDLVVDTATVKECIIQTGIRCAGGVIGAADTYSLNTDLNNIVIDSCKIGYNGAIYNSFTDSGAGGVFGKVGSNDARGSHKLKKITVTNSYLYGKSTGGIAGYVHNYQHMGNVWSDGTEYEINIKDNYMFGCWTGGVIGEDRSTRLCFENVNVEGNTLVALRNDSAYSAAGGFAGYEICASEQKNLNHITIKNNYLVSGNTQQTYSAGGVFGYLSIGGKLYAYDTVVEDNEIGYYETDGTTNNKLLRSVTLENLLQTMVTTLDEAKTKKPKLMYHSSNLAAGTWVESLPDSMLETSIAQYAKYFGNLIGVYDSAGHAYFLDPTVTYSNTYSSIRPVVDVGSTTTGVMSSKLMTYPYSYRQNIHVIYHEPDSTSSNTAAQVWGTTDDEKQRLFSMVNMDAVLDEYKNAISGSSTTTQLLEAYRLNVQDDTGNTVSDIYAKVYNDTENDGYLSPLKVGTGADKKTLPLIVIDTQYGTTDQLITSVLAALTGVGGVQNSGNTNRNNVYDAGINHITGISIQPMKVENGVISTDNSGRKASIKYSNNRIEISDNGFDTAEEDGDGTFTLLTIQYKQKDYAAIDATVNRIGKSVTLQIPIFVLERLTIDTHLKIAEGEVYNVDTAKEKGLCTAPLLANNSSYTLYMEYIYGEARNKYSTDGNPIRIDKTIGMTYTDENNNVCETDFWKGTRLTLIDVCDSDKVYYYTVTGEEGRPIKYTDFKDANGNSYVNKPIHGTQGMEIYTGANKFVTQDSEKINNVYVDKTFAYENVAVERFLIVVDTTQVDEALKDNTSDIRNYEITLELSDDVMKRTTLTEHTDLQITRQPGLAITLVPVGQENEPKIDGMIAEEGNVTIDATFQIEGDSQYWARVLASQATTIDSANHYKYVDVGIYLTDKNGNRVKLPDNTNVTINGKQLQPWEEVTMQETNLGAYVNQSTVYFYKDGRIIFPLDVLKDMIQREMDENAGRTKGIVTENCKFELNFSNANLSNYTENEYEVHLELLRVEDPEYPAGGEVIDTYVGIVPAVRKTDIACALETEDLMQLGINTYNQQTTMPHIINFDFKMDFNGVISNNQAMNQQIADKYYTVTYRILEKINRNGTPQYEPYTGDQLSLELINPKQEEQQELLTGPSCMEEECNSVYITYQFDWNEIENGTNGLDGVITRDLQLMVNDAERLDLSNYKIQASVMVSDVAPGDIDQVVNSSLSDFFVFTVAKLKTDLDY